MAVHDCVPQHMEMFPYKFSEQTTKYKEIPMAKKKKALYPKKDYITDIDVITENGIVRDEKGRFVKGHRPPGPPKKIKKLQELIERKTGSGEKLINQLVKLSMYDPDETILVTDKETGEVTEKKKRYHWVPATVQLQAITLLMNYYFGKPQENINVDKNVNVNIEKKVADITQLINENKERLKVVK